MTYLSGPLFKKIFLDLPPPRHPNKSNENLTIALRSFIRFIFIYFVYFSDAIIEINNPPFYSLMFLGSYFPPQPKIELINK